MSNSTVRPTRAWTGAPYETNLKTALDRISAAYKRTLPSDVVYKKVAVFSITFSNDDINVGPPETALLDIFRQQYGFDIVRHVINVRARPVRDLLAAIHALTTNYDHEDNMIILYYCGHAEETGNSMTLYGSYETLKRKIDGIPYTYISPSLIGLRADTLFFLDCRNTTQVAAGINPAAGGAHEMICASGWKSNAGSHPTTDCWTYKLIEHLKYLAGTPRTIAQIHGDIMVPASNPSESLFRGTPVYIPARAKRSITLKPLVKPKLPTLQAGDIPTSKGAVLLTVNFNGVHGHTEQDAYMTWLETAPPDLRNGIKLETINASATSTIVLLQVPWAVWLQLEDHPAWHYVAKVDPMSSEDVVLPPC